MWARRFWVDVAERAVKTAAQAAASMLVGGQVGILDVDWPAVGAVAGMAAVASLLSSLASGRVGRSDTASLV